MEPDAVEWTKSASYVALAAVVLMNAVGNLLLKIGATPTVSRPLLASFAGLACFVFSVLAYAFALRSVTLNAAQIAVSSQYVLAILAAALILGESISITKWVGITLIAAGLFVTTR